MLMNGNYALVIGGSNGIGLSIVSKLIERKYERVCILDKTEPAIQLGKNVEFSKLNLLSCDYSVLTNFFDIDTLIFTAGFGRVASFEELQEAEIINSFLVNAISVARVLHVFYNKLCGNKDFYCCVMGSISGLISSPMFSVYGATKASVCKLIESVNIELEMRESKNRILNVVPGSIRGTKFNPDDQNDLNLTSDLANSILERMFSRSTIYIPEYEKIYKSVLKNYQDDPHGFGVKSYKYKLKTGRRSKNPQISIGYLSGTFDLFHIGHLNLLRRAKEHCDYLIVGVHRDGSHKNKEVFIPFDERIEIVKSIRYVDEVIESLPEDDAVYNEIVKYHYLFVGSDYKGSERFNRYEEYFKDKNVEIVYFPYTKETSSTQLRTAIDSSSDKQRSAK